MKRFLKIIDPIRVKAVRVMLTSSILGMYMFVVTPGWVYLKHQSVFAVLSAFSK
jgi:hypothetical protein